MAAICSPVACARACCRSNIACSSANGCWKSAVSARTPICAFNSANCCTTVATCSPAWRECAECRPCSRSTRAFRSASACLKPAASSWRAANPAAACSRPACQCSSCAACCLRKKRPQFAQLLLGHLLPSLGLRLLIGELVCRRRGLLVRGLQLCRLSGLLTIDSRLPLRHFGQLLPQPMGFLPLIPGGGRLQGPLVRSNPLDHRGQFVEHAVEEILELTMTARISFSACGRRSGVALESDGSLDTFIRWA